MLLQASCTFSCSLTASFSTKTKCLKASEWFVDEFNVVSMLEGAVGRHWLKNSKKEKIKIEDETVLETEEMNISEDEESEQNLENDDK